MKKRQNGRKLAEELHEALNDLWADLNDTGEDRHPNTGKEYQTAREARMMLRKSAKAFGR